jgi:hypothetical protein
MPAALTAPTAVMASGVTASGLVVRRGAVATEAGATAAEVM